MRIFGAVGLALTIVALKLLMGDVFAALEQTLLQFFEVAQEALAISQESLRGF